MLSSLALILGITLIAAMALEFVNWYFVYRKQDYQELNLRVKALSKRQAKLEQDASGKNAAKKLAQVQKQLTESQQELSMKKFKSTIIIGVFMLFSFSQLNKVFAGKPVAKLPFMPFGLISGVTHRGVEGSDYTECSFFFIYVSAGMFFRTVIQKFCGFEGAKSSFNPMLGK